MTGLFTFVSGARVGAEIRVSLLTVTVFSLEVWFRFIDHDVKVSTTIFFICEINAFIIRSINHTQTYPSVLYISISLCSDIYFDKIKIFHQFSL